jgi:glycosyltransferase involved in cell wall biosynthesis
MPLVSVIIPTYNRAASIGNAIRSVLDQTETDFEILVVDDASTDDTKSAVKAFQDSRIRYCLQPVNKGDAASRNAGIKQSLAPYIAFLDDDDEWLPEKLRLQLGEFERVPEAGLVHTAEYVVSGERISRSGAVAEDGETQVRRSQITTSSVIVRRRSIDTVGVFDETMPCASDWDLWIRLSRAYPVRYVDVPLVRYLASKAGLSGNIQKIIEGQGRVFAKHAAYFEQEPRSYSHYLVAFGFLCCYAGQLRRGRAALKKAVRLRPAAWEAYVHYALSLTGTQGFRALETLPRRLGVPWGAESWDRRA